MEGRMEVGRIAKWAKTQVPGTRRPPDRPPKQWRESWVPTSQEGAPSD